MAKTVGEGSGGGSRPSAPRSYAHDSDKAVPSPMAARYATTPRATAKPFDLFDTIRGMLPNFAPPVIGSAPKPKYGIPSNNRVQRYGPKK